MRASRANLFRLLSAGLLAAGLFSQAHAVSVDTELLLLVDTTNSALNNNDFDSLMSAYATAFTSNQILTSIQSGAYQQIAVSLMFFGNTNSQQVGIPWMLIGNSTQAQSFANQLLALNKPNFGGNPDVAVALTAAANSFGTETGHASNGFESEVQIIETTSTKRPNNNTATATANSSAAAQTSGVDLINSISLGNQASQVDAFYTANVIGSTIQGVLPSHSTAPMNGTLATNLGSMISGTIQTGANTSLITAVPEPSSALALAASSLFVLRRRR